MKLILCLVFVIYVKQASAYLQVSGKIDDCLKCLVDAKQYWCPLKDSFDKGMCIERGSSKYNSSVELGYCSVNIEEIDHREKLRL